MTDLTIATMDEQLKQRLVGAAVLVAVAVVFIPMLLRPPPADPPSVAAPSVPERPAFSSNVVPVEPAGVGAGAAPDRPLAAVRRPAADAERATERAPERAPERTPERTPERNPGRAPQGAAERPPPPTTRAPVVAEGQWVIQLGSFSNSRNASALTERLKAKGYPAFTRSADSSRGPVTRVYVGPSPSREAAGKVVERLRRETNLRGIVVRAASV